MPVPTSGLVLHYDLDSYVSGNIPDASGNGHDGVITSGSVSGGVLLLGNGYVTPQIPPVAVPAMTLSVWLQMTDGQCCVWSSSGSAAYAGLLQSSTAASYTGGSGQAYWVDGVNVGLLNRQDLAAAIADGNPHHFVYTVSSGGGGIWAGTWYFGKYAQLTSFNTNGESWGHRVYDRVLSDSEIGDLFGEFGAGASTRRRREAQRKIGGPF